MPQGAPPLAPGWLPFASGRNSGSTNKKRHWATFAILGMFLKQTCCTGWRKQLKWVSLDAIYLRWFLGEFKFLASLSSDALGVTVYSITIRSNPIQPNRHLAFSVLNLSIDLNCPKLNINVRGTRTLLCTGCRARLSCLKNPFNLYSV